MDFDPYSVLRVSRDEDIQATLAKMPLEIGRQDSGASARFMQPSAIGSRNRQTVEQLPLDSSTVSAIYPPEKINADSTNARQDRLFYSLIPTRVDAAPKDGYACPNSGCQQVWYSMTSLETHMESCVRRPTVGFQFSHASSTRGSGASKVSGSSRVSISSRVSRSSRGSGSSTAASTISENIEPVIGRRYRYSVRGSAPLDRKDSKSDYAAPLSPSRSISDPSPDKIRLDSLLRQTEQLSLRIEEARSRRVKEEVRLFLERHHTRSQLIDDDWNPLGSRGKTPRRTPRPAVKLIDRSHQEEVRRPSESNRANSCSDHGAPFINKFYHDYESSQLQSRGHKDVTKVPQSLPCISLENAQDKHQADTRPGANAALYRGWREMEAVSKELVHLKSTEALNSIISATLTGKLDAKDGSLWTALHYAADNGLEIATKWLLKSGANIHSSTNQGFEPLHVATERGQISTVQILLNNGADINGSGRATGKSEVITPLELAVSRNEEELVLTLLHHSPDRQLVNEQYALRWAAEFGSPEIVLLLLKHGADPNSSNDDGCGTALHGACKKGNERVVEYLLQYGVDVGAKAFDGHDTKYRTALDIAMKEGHDSIVSQLLHARPTVDPEAPTALFEDSSRKARCQMSTSSKLNQNGESEAAINQPAPQQTRRLPSSMLKSKISQESTCIKKDRNVSTLFDLLPYC
jgi:hypothetical protein